jgi:hypothetical protein
MKPRLWIAVLLVFAATLAIVGVPVFLIRPFSSQTPTAVAVSYGLRRISPGVSLVAALFMIAGLIVTWRRSRWLGRIVWVLMAGVTAATAWFAQQNHFEWMFRPVPDPRFVALKDATGVDTDELVIGVALDRASLAFPVRRIGYHHVVNTTVGSVPIVATY